jgi:hypothetical protein
MPGYSIRIKGPDPQKLFAQLGRSTHMAVEVAMQEELQILFEMTQDQVPVMTGALKESGQVDGPAWAGTSVLEGRIGYGSPDVDYALYVHEDLDAYHAEGNAKFVENPVRDQAASGASGGRLKARISELML